MCDGRAVMPPRDLEGAIGEGIAVAVGRVIFGSLCYPSGDCARHLLVVLPN